MQSEPRPKSLKPSTESDGKLRNFGSPRIKASKKLAFKSPLHLSLRKSNKAKSSDCKGDEQAASSPSMSARMRLPRPSATNIDHFFGGFKSSSKKTASKVPQSVPNTPSALDFIATTNYQVRGTPQPIRSRSKSDGEENDSKHVKKETRPTPTGTNRFGFRILPATSPVTSNSGSSVKERRYHTLPAISTSKKVLKRLKANSSLPSTPRSGSPSPTFPLQRTECITPKRASHKDSLQSEQFVDQKRMRSLISRKNRTIIPCVRRGRSRVHSISGVSRRDTSTTSTSSTTFSTSTSTSSSGHRRHNCDLLGPPYSKPRTRTNSSASPSTSVSSLGNSRATPIDSSRESCSATKRRRGVTTGHRRGRSGLKSNFEKRLKGISPTEISLKEKPDLISMSPAEICMSGFCPSRSHTTGDSKTVKRFCDRNNNCDCAAVKSLKSSRQKPDHYSRWDNQGEEDALVLGPIYQISPLRSLPDGSSEGYCFGGGQIVTPMENKRDVEPLEPSGDNKTDLLPPQISESVALAAFELPLSSSSVVSQDCCPNHCFTANEERADGIGCSANTSTCSLASGGYSTGLDTNSVPDVKGETPKHAKKCAVSSISSPNPQNSARSWLRNRSFFLRLIETRRKQHKREWENKKGQCLPDRMPQFMQRDGVLQEIVDEMDEARSIIKIQESEIDELRSEIAKIREGAIEEECYRVEAEIYRERAENESRIFKATISDLQEQLHRKQKCEVVAPPGKDPGETQISMTSQDDAGSRETSVSSHIDGPQISPEHDLGYFSMKRKAIVEEKDTLAMCLSFASNEDKSNFEKLLSFRDVGCQMDGETITSGANLSTVISGNAVYHSRRSALKQSAAKLVGSVLPQVLLLSSLISKSEPSTIEAEILLRSFVLPLWREMLSSGI